MTLDLKDMECPAYKFFIKRELEKLGLKHKVISENRIVLTDNICGTQLLELKKALLPYGIELEETPLSSLSKRIKVAVNRLLYYSTEELKQMLPVYIHKNVTYADLDSIFEKENGTSIEEYFNEKKIDRAQVLLSYYKLNLIEISYQLGYSNITELNRQLKKVCEPSSLKSMQIS